MTEDLEKRVVVVIPAFNEAGVVGEVIRDIKKEGFNDVILVDDGSSDNTAKIGIESGAMVLTHRLNRGKGAATKTGMEASKMLNTDIVVTIDGDGQHLPADIHSVVSPILHGECDVVLGTRLKKRSDMPGHKVLTNHVANFVTWTFCGLWVSDSQSGFRAYSRNAADKITTLADAYDFESEIIKEVHRHRLPYKEVPIRVKYTDYSTNKITRQSASNGIKTFYKLVWKVLSF